MNFKQKLFNILIEGIEELPDEDNFGPACMCGEPAIEEYGKEACSDRCYKHLVIATENMPEKAQLACNYAVWYGHEAWPEVGRIILSSPWSIRHYAENVIKGRWPEGERVLKNGKHEKLWDSYKQKFNLSEIEALPDEDEFETVTWDHPSIVDFLKNQPPEDADDAYEFIESLFNSGTENEVDIDEYLAQFDSY